CSCSRPRCSAWTGSHGPQPSRGPGTAIRCRPRSGACSAAARTRSRVAPPRSTRTFSASACSAFPASPIPGANRRGVRRRAADEPALVEYETLLVERDGPVGWLVFNRPSAANAMDASMMQELEGAWLELDHDDGVRVIVNTGAGNAF